MRRSIIHDDRVAGKMGSVPDQPRLPVTTQEMMVIDRAMGSASEVLQKAVMRGGNRGSPPLLRNFLGRAHGVEQDLTPLATRQRMPEAATSEVDSVTSAKVGCPWFP